MSKFALVGRLLHLHDAFAGVVVRPPAVLDDLKVGACAGLLGAEEHGAPVIETP